jgi:uncharacterized protein (TIGR02246 family)
VTHREGRQEDEAAIGEVLTTLVTGFRDLDVSRLVGVYAEDADWTNAFGTSRHGRDAILAYLKQLFADPCFGAGRLVGQPEVSIRFEGEVAVVKTYVEREGQRLVGGGEIPVRRNHSLKVLAMREGHWVVVSEMYMDARDEETLAQPPSA